MDGSDHYRKAEELAAKAEEYLGQGDGQESAAVWAAVAQVHATLALAAATELNSPGRQQAVTAAFEPSSSTEDAPIFSPAIARRQSGEKPPPVVNPATRTSGNQA